MTNWLIRITTALAVVAVAVVAAITSYQRVYGLVRSRSEFGMTARPLPSTVDGSNAGQGTPARPSTPDGIGEN